MTYVICAVVSPRSIGASLFEAEQFSDKTLSDFTSSASDIAQVRMALIEAGFSITSESEATISI